MFAQALKGRHKYLFLSRPFRAIFTFRSSPGFYLGLLHFVPLGLCSEILFLDFDSGNQDSEHSIRNRCTLLDPSAAHHNLFIKKNRCLTWRDSALRFVKGDDYGVVFSGCNRRFRFFRT